MSSDLSLHALAPGTRILDYTIQSVIGTGGFSIVYKAMDTSLMREVAIKEYFPAAFALRGHDGTVQAHSREADTFRTGITSFMNEGKLLAQFDHPALVRVYRCWEERGTAYLAMRLYSGMTLREAVKSGAWTADEFSMNALLAPLCDTLELLHAANCYHRDVAPDNILLSDGRAPVLLDFGAARKAIEGTQVFTAILKPGYAPIEQYGDGELKQGPWTDIYALAGVMHFALAGEAPPTAISRMLRDSMPRPRDRFAGRLPESWLDALEHALAVKPENRPQSIDEFVGLFGWRDPAPLPVDQPSTITITERPVTILTPPPVSAPVASTPSGPSVTELMREAARAEALDDDRTVVMPRRAPSAAAAVSSAPPPVPQKQLVAARAPAKSGLPTWLWIAGSVVAVAAVGLFGWRMSRPSMAVDKGSVEVARPPAVRNDTPPAQKPSLPKEAPATAVPDVVVKPAETPPPTKPAPIVTEPAATITKSTPPVTTAPTASTATKAAAKTESKAARKARESAADDDTAEATSTRGNKQPARCVALLESFQLGTVLGNEEQRFLRENCR